MSRTPVIAIFDIGKTNKKFFLLDEQYRIARERSVQFAEIADDNGDPCEDLKSLTEWVQKTFTEAACMHAFNIRAINCSAYGASFVHVDAAGFPVCPLYNYLKPFPKPLQDTFYKSFGGETKLSVATASPVLGSLNSGLQLYRLKYERPELFRRIRYSLHLPQYISYLFSRTAVTDITSLGCHTALFDFAKNSYHEWVQCEGLDMKLAPMMACNSVVQATANTLEVACGTGLHDSSAALIPYLAVFTEPFALISTGTWCITLNPFNHEPLTAAELKQDCLCYLSYDGRPVKASRLFAGRWHEEQVKRLADHFQKDIDHYKDIAFTRAYVTKEPVADFSFNDLSAYHDYAHAYHGLMQWIVQEQCKSSSLVLSPGNVKRIFVDGGFANNPLYMHLLAEAFPAYEVFAASVSQATALGAALAIHDHWNTQSLPSDLVSLKYYAAKR